jgi:hypothetical protein
MTPDYLQQDGPNKSSPWVVIGAYGAIYNANTVYQIDACLEGLRWRPANHPDIDRLLDAREQITALRRVETVPCTLGIEKRCPPSQFASCTCSRMITEERKASAMKTRNAQP